MCVFIIYILSIYFWSIGSQFHSMALGDDKSKSCSNTPKGSISNLKNLDSPCTSCNKPFANNEKSIECFICKNWVHFKCTNITKPVFDFMSKYQSVQFLCFTCETAVNNGDKSNHLCNANDAVNNIQIQVRNLSTNIDDKLAIVEPLSNLITTLTKKIETLDTKVEEMVAKNNRYPFYTIKKI